MDSRSNGVYDGFPSLSSGIGTDGFGLRQIGSPLDRIVSGRQSMDKIDIDNQSTAYNSRFQFYNCKRPSLVRDQTSGDVVPREDSLVRAWRAVTEIDALLGSDFRPPGGPLTGVTEERPAVDDSYVKRLNFELEAALNVSLSFKERLRDSMKASRTASPPPPPHPAPQLHATSLSPAELGGTAPPPPSPAVGFGGGAVGGGGGGVGGELGGCAGGGAGGLGARGGVMHAGALGGWMGGGGGRTSSGGDLGGLTLTDPSPPSYSRGAPFPPRPTDSPSALLAPPLRSGSTLTGLGGGFGGIALGGTGSGGGGGGGGVAPIPATPTPTPATTVVVSSGVTPPTSTSTSNSRSTPPHYTTLRSALSHPFLTSHSAWGTPTHTAPSPPFATPGGATITPTPTHTPTHNPTHTPTPTPTGGSAVAATVTFATGPGMTSQLAPMPPLAASALSTAAAAAPLVPSTAVVAPPPAPPPVALYRRPSLLGGVGGVGGGIRVAVGSALDHGVWDSDGGWQPAERVHEVYVPPNLQRISPEDLVKIRELGRGCFGSVWLARWRGVEVALKELLQQAGAAGDGPPNEVFYEAERLASLRHPCVIAFYGIVVAPGSYATVVEYVRMGSLKNGLTRLRKQGADISKRLRLAIALQAARGMEYLHGQFVVHFDMKCDNLLCDLRDPGRPVVKIGDLGLSKKKKESFVSGNMRGTLPWMAPELFPGGRSLRPARVVGGQKGQGGEGQGQGKQVAQGGQEPQPSAQQGSRGVGGRGAASGPGSDVGVGDVCSGVGCGEGREGGDDGSGGGGGAVGAGEAGGTEVIVEDRVNEKVDVFSFGIVLWEIWQLGEQPYATLSLPDIFVGVMTGSLRPEVPPNCHPGWVEIMQACWHDNPHSRPSFSEIAERLDRLLEVVIAQEAAEAGAGESGAATDSPEGVAGVATTHNDRI